jgi:hypothetical protein
MENVPLFSVLVEKESNPGIAVGIVLNCCDFCRNIVLIALKVDEPVKLFMTPTATTAGNYTTIIAAFRAMD